MTISATTPVDVARPAQRSGIGFARLLALAMRELRSGIGGFYVFIACVALGVMVITGVGALSDAMRAGFERQGEKILGGDVTFARTHTRATETERAWFDSQGSVSETATLRAMGRRLDGEDQGVIELKGVDKAYPLVGEVALADGSSFAEAIHGGPFAVADPVLLERLKLEPGDSMRIGEKEIVVKGILKSEPDGLADRLTYGPRVFVSTETLMQTGLVQPGTLLRWRYAEKLSATQGDDRKALVTFRDTAKKALPNAGFTVADRRDPSPQVTRTLDRLRQFLTLLGLTALLVGGVGVANAVATFIDRRRKVIATMKSLGATSQTVFGIFLIQVMAMAGLGVAVGLASGFFLPSVLTAGLGDTLPILPEFTITWRSVATAIAYGFLVSLLFALWPLGRAEQITASMLFRDEVAPQQVLPRRRVLVAMAACVAGLLLVAVLSSEAPRIAFYFCAGLTIVFAVFIGLGSLIVWGAARIRRPRRPELALAIGNLAAPGGLTRSVVLSLGSGLSLLVAVALTDNSLVDELTSRMPDQSPNYFVLDIPKASYAGLKDLVLREAPGSHLEDAPMLRGRIISLKGTPAEQVKAPPEAQWVLNGDRGLTFSQTVPDGSKVVKGSWWPADYTGEPLVSFEAELAEKLGVGIGDSVTVNVLGRNLTARISNLREVKWESLSLNFVMVFSPNALAGAPYNLLATITMTKGATVESEARLARELGKAYPAVTAIRVKDAIDAFNAVFTKVMTAVRVAGSVTLVSGALVLAGALATAQRRRILEAVILKTLGATRRRILASHFAEYLLLAILTAALAVVLGSLAAWFAVSHVMELDFVFSWSAVLWALGVATGLVALFGGIGTWAVLSARPVPYLRSE